MASHLRYFVNYGGHPYSGANALGKLKILSGLDEVKTMAQAIEAEKTINAKVGKHVCDVFIFREKRGLKRKVSRYRKMVYYFGTSLPASRRKKIQHGGTHPPNGPTSVTQGVGFFQQPTIGFAHYQFGGSNAAPNNHN